MTTAPAITVNGDEMSICFDRFDIEAYRLFLRAKRLPEYRLAFNDEAMTYTITAPARFVAMLGVDLPAATVTDLPLLDALLDDQVAITEMALRAKRFAVWADCGLGKTLIGLEFARQVMHRTGGRVLIFTLNEIVPQWIEEAAKFYGDTLPIVRLDSRAAMKEWCRGEGLRAGTHLAVTNYEKLNHRSEADQVVNELRHLAGVIADESSRLKTGGGKQKWALIKSAKGIEFKLSCTATPAPNEIMEFASQASFLEKLRHENEIIWTYFRRDEKTHRWTVKPHARQAFFEFMAGWSIYVRDPRKYGWRKNMPVVPEPKIIEHELSPTEPQRQFIVDFHQTDDGTLSLVPTEHTNTIQRNKLSQVAKGFCYRKGENGAFDRIDSLKPRRVAEIIRDEVDAGRQVLVWTVFDAESEIISDELMGMHLLGFDVLTGRVPKGRRGGMLERFRRGESQVLISRPVMLGYGMNLQHCGAMVFSGFNDSYEQFYQALRRAYRFGQTQRLRVHIPFIPELEGEVWENILRKQAQHEQAIAEMEANYIAATRLLREAA